MSRMNEKEALYSGYAVNTTYTDVGSADIAGANICHPCRLDCSIHAADNPEYRAAFACRRTVNRVAVNKKS